MTTKIKIEIYSTVDKYIHARTQDIFEFGMSVANTKKFIAELERALAQLEAAMPNAEDSSRRLEKEHDAICREHELLDDDSSSSQVASRDYRVT